MSSSRFLTGHQFAYADLSNLSVLGVSEVRSITDEEYIDPATSKIKTSLIPAGLSSNNVYTAADIPARDALVAGVPLVQGDTVKVLDSPVPSLYIWNGSAFVTTYVNGALGDVSDVSITTPVDKQLLHYDPAAGGSWKNKKVDTSYLSDVSVTNPQAGEILKFEDTFSTFQNSTLSTSDLSDVSAPVLLNGDILVHNSGTWVNERPKTDLMDTNGDMLMRFAGSTSKLAIGAENEVLSVVGGYPSWSAAGSSTLSGLTDTTITGAAEDDRLVLQSSVWVNQSRLPTLKVYTNTTTRDTAFDNSELIQGDTILLTDPTPKEFQIFDGINFHTLSVSLVEPANAFISFRWDLLAGTPPFAATDINSVGGFAAPMTITANTGAAPDIITVNTGRGSVTKAVAFTSTTLDYVGDGFGDFNILSGDFTVEFLALSNQTAGIDDFLFSLRDSSPEVWVRMNNTTVYATFYNGGAQVTIGSGWHHIAFVMKNGGTSELWVDGVLSNTTTTSAHPTLTTGCNAYVGTLTEAASEITGELSFLNIYDRALTSGEFIYAVPD